MHTRQKVNEAVRSNSFHISTVTLFTLVNNIELIFAFYETFLRDAKRVRFQQVWTRGYNQWTPGRALVKNFSDNT
jgi:hypothetical protein